MVAQQDKLVHLIKKLFPAAWLAILLKAVFGMSLFSHSANLSLARMNSANVNEPMHKSEIP